MRCPEALGAGGAIAGVLKLAEHRIAVLQVDSRSLGAHRVAGTGAATGPGNFAVGGEVGVITASDGSQGPTQLGRFLRSVGADTQAGLGVLLAGRRATVNGEAVVRRAGRGRRESEAPTRRIGVFLDDDRAAYICIDKGAGGGLAE